MPTLRSRRNDQEKALPALRADCHAQLVHNRASVVLLHSLCLIGAEPMANDQSPVI